MKFVAIILYAFIFGPVWLCMMVLLTPVFIFAGIVDFWLDRQYYKYHFNQNFKCIAFHSLIEKKVLIGYLIVVVLLAICYFIYHNSFGQLLPSSYDDIIESFLRINSILVGVVISLLILTFRVLNENFGSYAFRAVFKSNYNRTLITMFLLNFFLTLYVLGYWDQNSTIDTYYHFLFWIGLLSNIILLCLAFPLAFLSLKSASNISHIDAIIDSLDDDWIGRYQINNMNFSREIYPLKENPIEEIRQMSRKAISSEDYETFRRVSDCFYDHLKQKSNENDSLLGFFLYEYREYIDNLFSLAVKSEDIHFTIYLVNKRIELEQFFLKLDIPKVQNPLWRNQLHYLSVDFGPFVHKSLLVDDLRHIEEVLRAYFRIGEFYIREIIPNELPEFDQSKFADHTHIKFFISSYFGSSIVSMADRFSEEKKLRSFKGLFTLFSLQATVLASSASESTKKWVIHVLEIAKRDTFKIYVDSNPRRIAYLFFPFSQSYIFDQELRKLGRIQTLNGLLWGCDYALQGGKLNNMILNHLKAAMLGLIRLKKEENIEIDMPFNLCLEEFNKLRSNLKDSVNLHDQDMYVKIHEYLTIVENVCREQGVIDGELSSKFLVLFNRFEKLKEFQESLESSNYLRDESIT